MSFKLLSMVDWVILLIVPMILNCQITNVHIGIIISSGEGSMLRQCVIGWLGERVNININIINSHTYNMSTFYQQGSDMWRYDIIVRQVKTIDLYYRQEYVNENSFDFKPLSTFKPSDWLWDIHVKQTAPITDRETNRFVLDECSNHRTDVEFLTGVILGLGWKSVSILYDTEYGGITDEVAPSLSESGIAINQFKLRPNQSNLQIVQTSYNMVTQGWRNYALLANSHSVQALFNELNRFDSNGLSSSGIKSFSLWLVWGAEGTAKELEGHVGNISNIAVVERLGCDGSGLLSRFGFLSKDTCCNLPVFDLQSYGQMAIHNRHVLQVQNGILNALQPEGFKLFKLTTAMWKSQGRRFDAISYGVGNSSNVRQGKLYPNTEFGLNKMYLMVTTLPWPVFVIKTKTALGQIKYEGLCIDLMDELSIALNFSYTLYEPDDQEWGRLLDNRWTGLMGETVYKRADIVAAPLSRQAERMAVVDFTISFYTDYNEIFMRMPDREESRWKILIRPFHWRVLVVIAVIFPVTTFCVWISEKLSPFTCNRQRRDNYPGLHHANECFWYMFGALIARCGIYLPKSLSGRCIVGFWWLFIVLLVAAYSANLMALLAVTRETKPFNSIAEMVAQTDYIWGVSNGTYMLELLKRSKDSRYKQIWEGLQRFAESDESIYHHDILTQTRRVQQGGYAFIADSTAVDTALPTDCNLVKADEQFLMLQYCFAMYKGSPFNSMFSEKITTFNEGGLIDMWVKKWTPKAVPCPALLQTGAKQIMLTDVQSSFYVLFFGILLAVAFFIIEMFWRI